MPLSLNFALQQTDRDRMQRFFSEYVDVDPTAVPATDSDDIYDPVLLTADEPGTNDMAGALLAVRPKIVVAEATAASLGMSTRFGHATSGSVVMNLDLLAVSPSYRRQGVGTQLLRAAEEQMQMRGTAIVFGSVTDEDDSDNLAAFYRSAGYQVQDPQMPLPPFRGRVWTLPQEPQPLWWFWRKLPAI